MSNTRLAKFRKVLDEPTVDLEALRELCWSGVPPQVGMGSSWVAPAGVAAPRS